MSARESFDFESAAEKLFESSQLQLLLVEGVACEPVPVAAALCVMAQASDFMNTVAEPGTRSVRSLSSNASVNENISAALAPVRPL